jgi:hypothetical protein
MIFATMRWMRRDGPPSAPALSTSPARGYPGERIFLEEGERRFSMETNNSQHKKQVGVADVAFVAFLILITAIAGTLTLLQIYLQNPK